MYVERIVGLTLSPGHSDIALAVIRRIPPPTPTLDEEIARKWQARPKPDLVGYRIERVETAPRVTYELLVEHLAAVADANGDPPIVVDTGIGTQLMTAMGQRRIHVVALRFTGAQSEGHESVGRPISDVEMVTTLGMLLEAEPPRVTIGEKVSGATTLLRQLAAIRRWDAVGREAFRGSLGDLVVAVGMALWFGERCLGNRVVFAPKVKLIYT